MAKKRIGELLVEGGYVTQHQVKQALEIQKTRDERICSILIDLGHLSEEAFFKFMSETSSAAGVDLASYEIDKNVLELVPAEVATELEVVPIGLISDTLTLAMVCPIDHKGLEELKKVTSLNIKPVLCSREAVRHALERYYSGSRKADLGNQRAEEIANLKSLMTLRRIGKFVEETEELPTLPDILTTISSVVNDPKSSAAGLAKVIASDASLSAKILKVANSAAYGFLRDISDIKQAVTLLGFAETQSLALSVAVFDYLTDLTELEFKEYWNHSFKCATMSRLISFNLKSPGIEGAFVAGLLHDIGKVALAMGMRGMQDIVNSLWAINGADRIEAEEKLLGLTHAEAGYLLGEHWLLPVNLSSAVRYHHSPKMEGGANRLASVVFLANTFCRLDESELRAKSPFSDDVLEVLGTLEMSENAFRKTMNVYSDLIPEAALF